jgi:amino acid transporter
MFVLLVANGAALWNGFHLLPFLASYLTVSDIWLSLVGGVLIVKHLQVIVFIGIWILLKIFRSAPWSFVDLSQPKRVAEIFRHLHDIRLGGTDSTEDISEG